MHAARESFLSIFFRGGWAPRSQALDIVKIIYLTQDMVETLHVVSITFYVKKNNLVLEFNYGTIYDFIKKEDKNMKETKKQILIRLNKNTDLIKKEEKKNSATRRLANLLNGTSGKKLFRG